MSRRPTRPPSRSLTAATARAFRSLCCTGEVSIFLVRFFSLDHLDGYLFSVFVFQSALDVLAEASTESRPHDDAPPAGSGRPGDAASAASEPSVERPAPPASVLGPYPASSEALRPPRAEAPGDSP
ncbi:hypothetical protein PF003_g38129 [Phytophthora fragariae]|nr:hypothetical protein PF003_g38129 [Phytophthora fragariae]